MKVGNEIMAGKRQTKKAKSFLSDVITILIVMLVLSIIGYMFLKGARQNFHDYCQYHTRADINCLLAGN